MFVCHNFPFSLVLGFSLFNPLLFFFFPFFLFSLCLGVHMGTEACNSA
uniref:Uncharacterized protein n=1 Tax=Rhizophora mucronata TaxID=61149 RepID=A0A2P2QKB2_RHIMU